MATQFVWPNERFCIWSILKSGQATNELKLQVFEIKHFANYMIVITICLMCYKDLSKKHNLSLRWTLSGLFHRNRKFVLYILILTTNYTVYHTKLWSSQRMLLVNLGCLLLLGTLSHLWYAQWSVLNLFLILHSD